MSGTILETDRLLLRRQTADDIPALVPLWSDPQVTRHLGGPRERRLVALIEPSHVGSARVAVKVGMRFAREVPRPGGARKRVCLVEAGGTTGADTDRVIPPGG